MTLQPRELVKMWVQPKGKPDEGRYEWFEVTEDGESFIPSEGPCPPAA